MPEEEETTPPTDDETIALTQDELDAGQLEGDEEPAPIYPLGLPKGSVRAMTALLIFLVACVLILTGRTVPVELRMTLILTLSYYFAARPKMVGGKPPPAHKKQANPLWLPRGSMRLIFVAGFGLLVFLVFRKAGTDFTDDVWSDNLGTIALIGAFLFGNLLRPLLDRMLSMFGERATVLVLGGHLRGMVALGATVLYSLAILFNQIGELPDAADKIFLFVVGFYFGNRN